MSASAECGHGLRAVHWSSCAFCCRDYAFEGRYADGDFARMPLLAEELVRLNPDVIIASNTSAALAIKQSTTSTPIVVGSLTDPVGSGLVVSEARPGTNVTGMRTNLEGLPGKQIELAHEVAGTVAKVAVLFNAKNPSNVWQRQDVDATAARLRVAVLPFSVQTADEAGPAVQTIGREGASIVVVLADAMFLSIRRQIFLRVGVSPSHALRLARACRRRRFDELWYQFA